jgi:hypothetical protein
VGVGHSAHDIALSGIVRLAGPRPGNLTLDSRVEEFLTHPVTGPILSRAAGGAADRTEGGTSLLDMVGSMPMRRLMRFPGVGDSLDRIGTLMRIANNPVVRGVASWWGRVRKR